MNTPLVSICCITYNHGKYIEECLKGFLMQETNFPFEIVIHDDASTDNTASIIREYEKKFPTIFKPIYQTENQFSKSKRGINVTFNYPRVMGKYIALCDGDDYWTDPRKLQRQVDYLEDNQDCGLVLTDVDRIYQNSDLIEKNILNTNKYSFCKSFEDFLIHAPFKAPSTWLFRKHLLQYPARCYVVGDLPLLLDLAARSRIHQLNETTAVYRVLTNSASHFTNIHKSYLFMKGIFQVQMDYALKYNVNERLIKTIQQNFAKKSYYYAVALNDKDQIKSADRLLKGVKGVSQKIKVVQFLNKLKLGRPFVKLKLKQ